jgi:hypothetical protein
MRKMKGKGMDILNIAGQNLSRAFNSSIGCLHAKHLFCYGEKLPSLQLKAWSRQLLGYFLLDVVLPEKSKCVL